MNELYLECYSGISGDMTVATLLDLGADDKKLKETLKELKIENEYEIKISKVIKCKVEANDFDVKLKPNRHTQRNLEDVYKIIDRLNDEQVKSLAKKIFKIVAEAEAKAHQKKIEEVYFHEKGATDSIIDIVSTAFCIVNLKIKNTYVSPLYEGQGFVHLPHVDLPIPVPAVLNIINEYKLPLEITNKEGEMITPTGAAIVATLKNTEKLPEKYIIKKVGIGAGKKYPDRPSVLKAMLIEKIDV